MKKNSTHKNDCYQLKSEKISIILDDTNQASFTVTEKNRFQTYNAVFLDDLQSSNENSFIEIINETIKRTKQYEVTSIQIVSSDKKICDWATKYGFSETQNGYGNNRHLIFHIKH